MATPRKLWRLTYDEPNLADVEDRFPSRVQAYGFVQALARSDNNGTASMWVDNRDGHGWRLHERIDLAEYGTEG